MPNTLMRGNGDGEEQLDRIGGKDTLLPRLGQGFYWQDLAVGQRFRTFRRTVTEINLVNFIGTTGMLEAVFIDASHEGGAIPGRPCRRYRPTR